VIAWWSRQFPTVLPGPRVVEGLLLGFRGVVAPLVVGWGLSAMVSFPTSLLMLGCLSLRARD
jgi:hypothetical protein